MSHIIEGDLNSPIILKNIVAPKRNDPICVTITTNANITIPKGATMEFHENPDHTVSLNIRFPLNQVEED